MHIHTFTRHVLQYTNVEAKPQRATAFPFFSCRLLDVSAAPTILFRTRLLAGYLNRWRRTRVPLPRMLLRPKTSLFLDMRRRDNLHKALTAWGLLTRQLCADRALARRKGARVAHQLVRGDTKLRAAGFSRWIEATRARRDEERRRVGCFERWKLFVLLCQVGGCGLWVGKRSCWSRCRRLVEVVGNSRMSMVCISTMSSSHPCNIANRANVEFRLADQARIFLVKNGGHSNLCGESQEPRAKPRVRGGLACTSCLHHLDLVIASTAGIESLLSLAPSLQLPFRRSSSFRLGVLII